MEDDTINTTCLEGVKIDSCSKLVLSEEILNFQHESSIPASLLESLYVSNRKTFLSMYLKNIIFFYCSNKPSMAGVNLINLSYNFDYLKHQYNI
jgi:hypothetical protein